MNKPAAPEPYGWHFLTVHRASGQVVNDSLWLNKPGQPKPPAKRRCPAPLTAFDNIAIPLYTRIPR